MSWPQWGRLQPTARRRHHDMFGDPLDAGPNFQIQPFDGLMGARQIVTSDEWQTTLEALLSGTIKCGTVRCSISTSTWSTTGILGARTAGHSDLHNVVHGARRPVTGLTTTLTAPAVPHSEATWELEVPGGVPRGQDLARMSAARRVLHWPMELLGIYWLGSDDFEAPTRFVVGRTAGDAWITGIDPHLEDEVPHVGVVLCWDADRIDPLSCTLVMRTEHDGVPVLVQSIRISDLPGDLQGTQEARNLGWAKRTMTCRIPRGPTGTAWGVSLIAPDGVLIDEMPTANRVESIHMSFSVMGSPQSSTRTTVVGDPRPRPEGRELDQAVVAARRVLRAATDAAAARRVSTLADLRDYLRWRFSCQSGELLLLDPYLLTGLDLTDTISFLCSLDHPIRALCAHVPDALLPARLEARRLPQGRRSLHDRVWIVGETGLLVGGSVSTFTSRGGSATTVTELPRADVAFWRQQFEAWWPR
jgi:hypothetical protein